MGTFLIFTVTFPAPSLDKSGRHPSMMTTHRMRAFNGSYQIYRSRDPSQRTSSSYNPGIGGGRSSSACASSRRLLGAITFSSK
jgi:hypothetical protein